MVTLNQRISRSIGQSRSNSLALAEWQGQGGGTQEEISQVTHHTYTQTGPSLASWIVDSLARFTPLFDVVKQIYISISKKTFYVFYFLSVGSNLSE